MLRLAVRGPLGLSNISEGCAEVWPENIRVIDNHSIPLRERVVDKCHDPLVWV